MERATFFQKQFSWEKDIRKTLNKVDFHDGIDFHSTVRVADAARTILNIRGDDL
jgi:hypothetical protein